MTSADRQAVLEVYDALDDIQTEDQAEAILDRLLEGVELRDDWPR